MKHNKKTLKKLALKVLSCFKSKGLKIVTAESCTGGLIATRLTDISGASEVLDRGFITYSNEAKIQMLNVSHETIEKFGAVSAETVKAMAIGALTASKADISIAVTGIAGPSGGTSEKPLGLVHLAIASKNSDTQHSSFIFKGNRKQIRQATTCEAMKMLIEATNF